MPDTTAALHALPRAQALTLLDGAASVAQAGQQPLAVLALDVDHFKAYQDAAGTDAAASVLERLSGLLASGLSEPALLGHLGGDEFLVVLPGTDLPAAQAKADALREAVRSGLADVDATPPLTITVGIAARPSAGSWTARDLLSLADARMTFAKKRLTPHHDLAWAGSLPSDWYARLDIDAQRWPSL
jgi:diguanylate cyclase (GGDEF)-like protein